MPDINDWLKTRPPCVQALAAEFPVDSVVMLHGKKHTIFGYTEDDQLILTPVDPTVNYELAMERRVYLCAKHLRDSGH